MPYISDENLLYFLEVDLRYSLLRGVGYSVFVLIGILLVFLAYGREGIKRTPALRIVGAVLLNALGTVMWGLSLLFLWDGSYGNDLVLCIATVVGLPLACGLWILRIRKRTKHMCRQEEEQEELAQTWQQRGNTYEQRQQEKIRRAKERNEQRLAAGDVPLLVDRSESMMVCPKCERSQRSDRKTCIFCKAEFEE